MFSLSLLPPDAVGVVVVVVVVVSLFLTSALLPCGLDFFSPSSPSKGGT